MEVFRLLHVCHSFKIVVISVVVLLLMLSMCTDLVRGLTHFYESWTLCAQDAKEGFGLSQKHRRHTHTHFIRGKLSKEKALCMNMPDQRAHKTIILPY